jgi:hypothetical protein
MARPSLGKKEPAGESKIVPVKMLESEKLAAQAVCDAGESLSGLIREATRREVKRRNRASQKTEIADEISLNQNLPGCIDH